MSLEITLKDDLGLPVTVNGFTHGGALQVIGGSVEAALHVPDSYDRAFAFRDLHGRKAVDTAAALRGATAKYGTDGDDSFWEPTAGNVGRACAQLLEWAEAHPDATWTVE